MKKIKETLSYLFDYVFVYMLYSTYTLPRYHKYMYKKWGEKYCTKKEYENYVRNLNHE